MRRAAFTVGVLAAALFAFVASTSRSAPTQPHPLQTAIDDPKTFDTPDAGVAFARTRAAGATAVMLTLRWTDVAPERPTAPADPGDPAYHWDAFDAQLKLAVAQGLEPVVTIMDAPLWAQQDPPSRTELPDWTRYLVDDWSVDAAALGEFTAAAAQRYSGTFAGIPRVRYWQAWNEPNLSIFLNPQLTSQLTVRPSYPFDPADVVSPDAYRAMVNAMYAAVHAVHPDNLLIAGATEPFSGTSGVVALGPLLFMRKLLCMSADPTPTPTCNATADFDIWSTHPYTAGGPTHRATQPDDVSIPELPKMASLLRSAVAAGHVVSSQPVGFWVTEFGWDTKPPDCCAVPLQLDARWVAEGLYRMWLAGVTLVAWFEIRDEEPHGNPDGQVLQSGLYFRAAAIANDRPKPALAAFRFPFVAFRSGSKILVWGRTPWGKPGSVIVEQSSTRGWKQVGRFTTDSAGIFRGRVRPAGSGILVRARLVRSTLRAVPFSLVQPPDLPVNPFGG